MFLSQRRQQIIMSHPLHLFYETNKGFYQFSWTRFIAIQNLFVTITDLRRDAEDEQRTLFEHLHCIELEV